jgi:phage recombination protein Bet
MNEPSKNTALAATKQTLVQRFAEKYSVDESKFLDTLKATAFKQKDNVQITNEQMTMLLVVADQYGLNPFTKEIYAYPDKGAIVPVVSVDGWARIINENPQMDGLEFVYSPETKQQKGKTVHEWIDCIITRKDRAKPIVVREFLDEVMRTVNFATPWDSHPKRMHRHKVLIQAARLAFGFAGIFDQDEAERIIEADKAFEGETVSGEAVVIKDARKEITSMDKDEVVLRYGIDVMDNDSGEVTKFSKKSLIQQGEAKAQTLIDFISAKCILTDEAIAEIQSWEKK